MPLEMRPIGSEFHWTPSEGERHPLPSPHVLFATGRAALRELWKQHHVSGMLHLPTYYCQDVIDDWSRHGMACRTYDDLPTWGEPSWSSINARPGDAVLAVNFFGVRDQQGWTEWQLSHPGIRIIEDHTHDPFSKWAFQSTADFAFASLRKTQPIPDGAMLWSPRGCSLPVSGSKGQSHDIGSAMKYAGMVLKSAFLQANPENRKELFEVMRYLQVDGETHLSNESGRDIAPWSKQHISEGYDISIRTQRESRVREFLDQIEECELGRCGVQPLFQNWPRGACPLNPILVFSDSTSRDRFRTELISEQVFAPIHWVLSPEADPKAAELSSRLLTIPVDHRCDRQDIDRIKQILDRMAFSTSARRLKAA